MNFEGVCVDGEDDTPLFCTLEIDSVFMFMKTGSQSALIGNAAKGFDEIRLLRQEVSLLSLVSNSCVLILFYMLPFCFCLSLFTIS